MSSNRHILFVIVVLGSIAAAPPLAFSDEKPSQPVVAADLKSMPTDKLTEMTAKGAGGEMQEHSINGLWLSEDAAICIVQLEDGKRRSCLMSHTKLMNARTLMVSNGSGYLLTFIRIDEMTRGRPSDGYIPYRDNAKSRGWFETGNIDDRMKHRRGQ